MKEMRTSIETDTDVTRALYDDAESLTAGDVSSTDVLTIYPDQTLADALGVFGVRGVHALPVVLRDQLSIPCGILKRSDVTNAYANATDRRETRLRRGQLEPVISDDVRYLEMRMERGSTLNGHRLSEVELPENTIMVAVRHEGATLIPRGNTRLLAGDRVTVIAGATAIHRLQEMFQRPGNDKPSGS